MNDPAAGDARPFRPWGLRAGDPLDARRRELFALAAPVFRRHGYRDATIKALAHACGLSPSSLYHYFSSKEDMATYVVRRPRMDWDSIWVDPAVEPLRQLRLLVDLALAELPTYLLAFRLVDEIGSGDAQGAAQARLFREGESMFARLLVATAPRMPRAEAERTARFGLSAMVGSASIGIDPEPEAEMRSRVVAVLRLALVPEHLEAGRYDAAMGPAEQKG